eukprot:gnl/MRDRNA2_/MRDRNA2_78454_c0_seq2.p1 gnl/MRDRNA2_/MRDRNA2_78454_c0~~gnl/MRDRNA2_/MRDRNA2_78454_c0_seq2.p1  ORF type:complete len:306 (-),score=65.71 gnl/MRDRNA2_/MRDRNA2_78454_c0_seq2:20-937(-)
MAGLQQTPLQMMRGMMVLGDDASQFIMPPADGSDPAAKPWWRKFTGGGASSSGSAAQESLQLLAMPAQLSGYIYRVVLWLEEAPGPGPGSRGSSDRVDAGNSTLVVPALQGEVVRPADRLALGSFRVERGRSSIPGFGPEIAFLEANRLCPIQGVDVESRGLQCFELSPPLPVLRGQYVGLVNVEGGSLGTASQLKNWFWGDGEKGFWCGSLDTDGITAATCPLRLSCGSELSSRFRRRTSWLAGMCTVAPAAPNSERRAKERQRNTEPMVREATPKERVEKARLLSLEPPVMEEIILEGPPDKK